MSADPTRINQRLREMLESIADEIAPLRGPDLKAAPAPRAQPPVIQPPAWPADPVPASWPETRIEPPPPALPPMLEPEPRVSSEHALPPIPEPADASHAGMAPDATAPASSMAGAMTGWADEEQALPTPPPPVSDFERGEMAMRAGDYPSASSAFHAAAAAARLVPERMEALRQAADAEAAGGDLEQAVITLDRLIDAGAGEVEQNPSLREPMATALLRSGRHLASLGRTQDALSTADELLDWLGEATDQGLRAVGTAALSDKVVWLGELGDERAIACFDQLRQLGHASTLDPAPALAVAHLLLARAEGMAGSGRHDAALSTFADIDERFGHDPSPAMTAILADAAAGGAQVFLDAGRPEEALAAIDHLRLTGHDAPDALRVAVARGLADRAERLGDQGYVDAAIDTFDRATRRFRDDGAPEARAQAGRALLSQIRLLLDANQIDDAEARLRSWPESLQEHREPAAALMARHLLNLASSAEAAGDVTAAERGYEAVVARFEFEADPAMRGVVREALAGVVRCSALAATPPDLAPIDDAAVPEVASVLHEPDEHNVEPGPQHTPLLDGVNAEVVDETGGPEVIAHLAEPQAAAEQPEPGLSPLDIPGAEPAPAAPHEPRHHDLEPAPDDTATPQVPDAEPVETPRHVSDTAVFATDLEEPEPEAEPPHADTEALSLDVPVAEPAFPATHEPRHHDVELAPYDPVPQASVAMEEPQPEADLTGAWRPHAESEPPRIGAAHQAEPTFPEPAPHPDATAEHPAEAQAPSVQTALVEGHQPPHQPSHHAGQPPSGPEAAADAAPTERAEAGPPRHGHPPAGLPAPATHETAPYDPGPLAAARAALEAGDAALAAQGFDSILADTTQLPDTARSEAQAGRARALAMLGREADAFAALSSITEPGQASPDAPTAAVARALLVRSASMAEAGQVREALTAIDALLERVDANGPHAGPEMHAARIAALTARVRCYGQLGQDASTISSYEALAAIDRPPADLRVRVARLMVVRGDRLANDDRGEEALAAFDAAERQFAHDEDPAVGEQFALSQFGRAYALGRLGRGQEALAIYDDIVRQHAGSLLPALREQAAKALVNRGIRLAELGDHEPALASFDEVIDRFGDITDNALVDPLRRAFVNRAEMLRLLGRPGEAATAIDLAVQRGFEAPQLREQVSQLLYAEGVRQGEIGEINGAIETYAYLVERFGDARELTIAEMVSRGLYSMAVRLGETDRNQEAVDAYDRLLARLGENPPLLMVPQAARAMLNKALRLVGLGDGDAALACYDQLIERFGGVASLQDPVARAMFCKASLLGDLGRIDEGIAVDREVASRFGDVIMLRELVLRARLHEAGLCVQQGKTEAAAALYREVRDTVASAKASSLMPFDQAAAERLAALELAAQPRIPVKPKRVVKKKL